MKNDKQSADIREAVGIFFKVEKIEETVEDLKAAGFKNEELGLLAGDFTVKEKLGHIYEEVNKDIDSPDAPQTAFVAKESIGDVPHALFGTLFITGAAVAGGAIVATAGVLGGALITAAATTAVIGGIGAVIGSLIHQSHAEYLEEQVDRGRLVLFVRTRDEDHEKQAMEILSKHAAYDPKIYSIPSTTTVAA